jgi:exonuclease VII small subunit
VPDRLSELVDRLEAAAASLRSGELAPDRAAALVDECARTAAEAGAELDRLVRGAEAHGEPPEGQLALESSP